MANNPVPLRRRHPSMAAGAVRSHHVNIGSALKRVPRAAAHIENCAFDVTKSGLLAWHRHGTSLMATSLGKAQEHKSLGYVTQGDSGWYAGTPT